jgi:hypothetical protein
VEKKNVGIFIELFNRPMHTCNLPKKLFIDGSFGFGVSPKNSCPILSKYWEKKKNIQHEKYTILLLLNYLYRHYEV